MLNCPPEPKYHCFRPKNGIFKPFLGKKWPFLGGVALNQPFFRFLALKHVYF